MAETSPGKLYRFGAFEVDEKTGEVRKQGRRLAVQGQPLQVLLMLLSRPGELVTRTEIQQALWPDGTFVDFDHGLNTAINKIREALGRLGCKSSVRRNAGQARLPFHTARSKPKEKVARSLGAAAAPNRPPSQLHQLHSRLRTGLSAKPADPTR